MILRLLSHIIANYPTILLNAIFPSIKNANNMNLSNTDAAYYLSTVTSAYFYGGVAGALCVKYIAHYNTQKLWRTVVTASIIVNICF
jgi:hypothetical protein